MFTFLQIQELLDIIANNNMIFIASKIGPDYLKEEEKARLIGLGINPYHIYRPENDFFLTQFHLGLISDAIGTFEADKLTFNDLKKYFLSGKYIPLSEIERNAINSVKTQCLSDIRALEGRIFRDVNNIIDRVNKNNRTAYEEVIREGIKQGLEDKKTPRQIASELGHKTGDWTRDFKRITEYVSHQAFDEGRAAMIERKKGAEAKVYKNVFDGACKYCIDLYMENGIGSQPKIFLLTELKNNGTNIGRKPKDWLPIIGSTHPYCRCTLDSYDPRFKWNPKTKAFDIVDVKVVEEKRVRKPVRFTVGSKEYSV